MAVQLGDVLSRTVGERTLTTWMTDCHARLARVAEPGRAVSRLSLSRHAHVAHHLRGPRASPNARAHRLPGERCMDGDDGSGEGEQRWRYSLRWPRRRLMRAVALTRPAKGIYANTCSSR